MAWTTCRWPCAINQPARIPVRIGAGAWIGSAAVVMADVGRDAVVGAGAVVTSRLPIASIAGACRRACCASATRLDRRRRRAGPVSHPSAALRAQPRRPPARVSHSAVAARSRRRSSWCRWCTTTKRRRTSMRSGRSCTRVTALRVPWLRNHAARGRDPGDGHATDARPARCARH